MGLVAGHRRPKGCGSSNLLLSAQNEWKRDGMASYSLAKGWSPKGRAGSNPVASSKINVEKSMCTFDVDTFFADLLVTAKNHHTKRKAEAPEPEVIPIEEQVEVATRLALRQARERAEGGCFTMRETQYSEDQEFLEALKQSLDAHGFKTSLNKRSHTNNDYKEVEEEYYSSITYYLEWRGHKREDWLG